VNGNADLAPLDGAHTGAGGVAIHQTAAYAYSTAQEMAEVFAGRAPGHIYTRISNPTTYTLERRLAELEGGVGCLATSSGMAAIAALALGLLRSGDEIVSAAGIFGGTISLFRNILGRLGIQTTLVEAGDAAQFRRALTPATRLLFAETIGNPRMDVPDIPALAELARERRLPLVIDSTLTTPALVRPKELGADIVIHSTTKFINGHGTAIGGALIDAGTFDWAKGPFPELRALARNAGGMAFLAHLRMLAYRDLGGCPAPGNSFLMLQGLETLEARMQAHCENARKLAERLSGHPGVAWVNYPGLESSPFHGRVRKFFGGRAGGLLTIGLGEERRAFRFVNALRRARIAANLGETRTLVIHPASTIFHEYEAPDRARMGVPEDMVRVSVGIGDFEEILQDALQALAASDKEVP